MPPPSRRCWCFHQQLKAKARRKKTEFPAVVGLCINNLKLACRSLPVVVGVCINNSKQEHAAKMQPVSTHNVPRWVPLAGIQRLMVYRVSHIQHLIHQQPEAKLKYRNKEFKFCFLRM